MVKPNITENGWSHVPRDPSQIFKDKPFLHEPTPLLVKDMEFPENDVVTGAVRKYAQRELLPQTYNHSMRVYYYSTAILKQQFPTYASLSPATLATTCLLHDIGTTAGRLNKSRMSFEFYGAIESRKLVMDLDGEEDQADAVCEAIIRHQDLGDTGTITLLGQLLQLATIFDNVSDHPYMKDVTKIIHEDTLKDVIKEFPRHGWLGCFADTVREEIKLKPWCHTTHIPDFDKQIEGNTFMKPYE